MAMHSSFNNPSTWVMKWWIPRIPRSPWRLGAGFDRPAVVAIPAQSVTMESAIQMDQLQVHSICFPTYLVGWASAYCARFCLRLQPGGRLECGRLQLSSDHTKSYLATDDTTAQWLGKPGFIDTTYVTNFWTPLPKHLWDQIPDNQWRAPPSHPTLRSAGVHLSSRVGGGDHITLTKNPHYFRRRRAAKISTLIFRFVPDPATAIRDLSAGRCDILDPSINLGGQGDILRSWRIKATPGFVRDNTVMEQLAFR